jgi:glucose-6-phosphate isomerase
MTMDSQIPFNTSRILGIEQMNDVYAAQDSLICSMFAHADELAFGNRSISDGLPVGPSSPLSLNQGSDRDVSEGNRPSLLLMTGKLDAFALGQLVALAEHRAVVKAHIWEVDPFVQEVGSSLRLYRAEQLKDELQMLFVYGVDEDEDARDSRMNLSTKTILGHYATLAKDQRS